ncbi:hypothetical protein IJ674_01095 [bacterium]|nr:hypothetical protein [bacterium]
MGMSASQARFLTLTARKTNVEYEGQQINQQRTTLSNESANYYSKLTSMDVPVPPSTADYTKVTYTFSDGSEKNTVTSIVATKDTKSTGIYMLNYVQEIPADNMVVSGTNVISKSNGGYFIGKVQLQDAVNLVYKNASTGAVTTKEISIIDNVSNTSATVPASNNSTQYYGLKQIRQRFIDAGIPTEVVNQYSIDQLRDKLKVENQYRAMSVEKYTDEDWYVRYIQNSSTGNYEPVFYSKKETENIDYNDRTSLSLGGVRAYMFGQTTESREIKNAEALVEKDASGRYQALFIYNDSTHESGTRYELTTITETDDNAYNDAMNQYYYDKAVYDQMVEEINAKIGIIQVQDKNLELKLKQLDTEENAISTEMDAVKKVISKNVESSFKTFNA